MVGSGCWVLVGALVGKWFWVRVGAESGWWFGVVMTGLALEKEAAFSLVSSDKGRTVISIRD